MSMIKKPAATKPKLTANKYLTTASPDDLGPNERIAYEIVKERRDLLPSVDKIMNAGLDKDATLHAITRFRDSLGTTGDPNRDPAVAIANSTPPPG
jgi:hypothetical protein